MIEIKSWEKSWFDNDFNTKVRIATLSNGQQLQCDWQTIIMGAATYMSATDEQIERAIRLLDKYEDCYFNLKWNDEDDQPRAFMVKDVKEWAIPEALYLHNTILQFVHDDICGGNIYLEHNERASGVKLH